MRTCSVLVLLLACACKSNPSTSEPTPSAAAAPPGTAATPGAAAATPGAAAATPGADSPHAALTPTARIIEPHRLAPLPQGRSGLGPFSLQVPAGWQEKPSVSNMRAAEFQLPASDGQAEVIVYYFGQSGAGSVQDNIDRWVSQFTQADGKPSSEVTLVEQATFAGQAASLVSVSGRYAARAMPGGEAVDKPDQSLLAAIVPSPKGPYYFRLIGDRAAVTAQSGQFRALLTSLKIE